jgi:hypothetical protein
MKTAVACVFALTPPEMRPIFIVGTISDETTETAQFVIFVYDITMGGFKRFGGI